MSSKKVSEFIRIVSNNDLVNYLLSVEITRPTEIQRKCIPKLLSSANFRVQGRTGSGKTLGYLLPIIEKLKKNERKNLRNQISTPKVIILLPTRELALQVYDIAKGASHFAKLRIRKLVGGDKGKSLSNLYNSQIDILITTPDRCLRSFKNKELLVDNLQTLVFDEADQLLDPSFRKTICEMLSIFNRKNTQIFLISASCPNNFTVLIDEIFPGKKFEIIGKGEENILNHKVEAYNIFLEEEDKFIYIHDFIQRQKKRNGLIFVGNKARAKKLFNLINESNHKKIFLLHKDLEIKDRVDIVSRFRKTGGILVTTDIFARGMDISHLEWVLNFDLPSDPDYYLHRLGRVGRVGKHGSAFNFVTKRDDIRHKKINESLTIQGRIDLKIPLRNKTNKNQRINK